MIDFISINAHSSIRIACEHVAGEKIIYADPFKLTDAPHDADIVLITHEHYDHYSPEDIAKADSGNTLYVMPAAMEGKPVPGKAIYMQPGDSAIVCGVQICAVPSYNVNKPMHQKQYGWLGYIVEVGGRRIYIAGDTDVNDDILQLRADIAMVPVGGTYTMDAPEAAQLINAVRPAVAIPTHYGDIVGTPADGEHFRSLVDSGIEVQLLI
ncbi:MAG: MBL fold metallo-hydrolase [Ruminococcaceae bacterium]|nr:MBL fold metallo-hydrolase [Oscillospiraceae bacterium]